MSIHPGSAVVPAFDNNARSPSPRASWQSKNSARTWIPSPHKAPLLEPVLTTTPVTRSPSHAGEYTSLEETEHMTIDIGVPDKESILGSRGVLGPKETKEAKKGLAGNLLDGLKRRLPEVVSVFGTDRKQAYQSDIPKATRQDSPSAKDQNQLRTTSPENGTDHDTAELGYVDPHPNLRVPVGQPTSARFQNPLPGITYPNNTRTFHHQGYDWSAATARPHDVQNYDHRVHHGHPYHLGDPQSQVHYGINGDTYNIPGAGDYDEANDARTPPVRYLPYPVHREHIGNSPEAGLHDEPVLPFNTVMSPILEAHSNSRSTDYAPTIHRPKLKIVRFLKSLYRLPWISSRITADYEPHGRIDDHQPTQVNLGSSWYTPRRYPLDLLSSGYSLPTTSVTHRRDRTLMSGTGSSSLQTATPARHHRSQGGRPSNTRRISLFRRDRGQRGEAQTSAESAEIPASPTIRGHRLDKPSHGRQRSRTGSHQYSTRRTDKRHKARTTSDLEPPAREHRSHKSSRYPQMVAAIPHVPPPQPLFILTPQSSDQPGLRQAVPVYVLTPHSASVALSPQNATDTQETARKPSPSPHPTPGSSRSHHTPPS